jgi:hypothetical protein
MTPLIWLMLLGTPPVKSYTADQPKTGSPQVSSPQAKRPRRRKVAEDLSAMVKAWRRCGQNCLAASAKKYDAEVQKDRIRIRVTARDASDVEAVKRDLERYGGSEVTALNETIFVLFPAKRVDKASRSALIDRMALSAGGSEPARAER